MVSLNLTTSRPAECWSAGVLECCVLITPSLHYSNPPAIQIALQQNSRRRLVHLLFAFGAARPALNQDPIRLSRGQPVVPRFDRNGNGVFQRGNEGLLFERRRAVGAVHVARQADED